MQKKSESHVNVIFDRKPDGDWHLDMSCTREELAFAIALLQARFTTWLSEDLDEKEGQIVHKKEAKK